MLCILLCIRVTEAKKVERVRGQWLECHWTASRNVWLHSRFVPWDHSCGRCRIDWEQLFCAPFSSYRRWHCLCSGDGQRGTLLSLNSVCSLRVGTKSPQTEPCSTSILGIGREGCGRRCQTEWDWWQDITRSWSHSHRTHGAINYADCGGSIGLQISLENAPIYCACQWKSDQIGIGWKSLKMTNLINV